MPYSELHIVGGLHPDWPFTYYLELVSAIKKDFPKLHIKAFTAVEIDYFSKISGLSLEETLKSLKRLRPRVNAGRRRGDIRACDQEQTLP